MLIRYCQAWADWHELTENIEKTGFLVRGQLGNPLRNRLRLMRADVERTLTELGRQLGLTPMPRLRSGIEHRQQKPEKPPDRVTPLEHYRKHLSV